MKRLLVVDLDGTILGGGYEPYQRIPDPMAAVLDDWTERGGAWAINSTWSAAQQLELLKASNIANPPAYLMAEMGLALYTFENGSPMPLEPFCTTMVRDLWRINHDILFPIMKGLCERFRLQTADFYGHIFEFMPRPDDQDRFDNYLDTHWDEWRKAGIQCRRPKGFPVSLHHESLHKGRNLLVAMEHGNWTPADVIVAGDSPPDLAMMGRNYTHLPICPANAHPDVLDYVGQFGVVGEGKASVGVIDALTKAGLPG